MKKCKPTSHELDISSDTDSEVNMPGPGQYIDINKHSIFNVNKNPDSFFGNQCPRFPKEKLKTEKGLDPGAYNVGGFKLDDHKHKGFTAAFANGDRFIKQKIPQVPGPGQYKASSLVNELMKKKTSKKGAFGSEAGRFIDQSPKFLEEEPGPGQYNPIDSLKTLDHKKDNNLKKHSSMFLSKTKREVQKNKMQDDIPSVGTYMP
jgi:hypothetical protein